MQSLAEGLQGVFDVHDAVADVHPCFEYVYPIAISVEGHLAIYEPDEVARTYRLAQKTPAPFPLPDQVRAAFPIADYDNRIACVVTPDVFSSLSGYATVFHEFVHCYQFNGVELELKNSLAVAREAHARGDFAWELNYPFPYTDSAFSAAYSAAYSAMLHALKASDRRAVVLRRAALRETLSPRDYEYMVWQQWKEGFARYVENNVRSRLGLEAISHDNSLPFSRTVFYEGGARLIEFFAGSEPDVIKDLRALFFMLKGP